MFLLRSQKGRRSGVDHGNKNMTVQISKKFKILKEEKLLKEQQEIEKKYGLKPHKRLRAEYLYTLVDKDSDELLNQDELGAMYQ